MKVLGPLINDNLPSTIPSKTRAHAPKLSPEILKSAQATLHGSLGDVNTGLLSPTVEDPWNRSPPPKREAADYVGSQAPGIWRQRHHARHQAQKSIRDGEFYYSSVLDHNKAAETMSHSDLQDSFSVTASSKNSSRTTSRPRDTLSPGLVSTAASKKSLPDVAFSKTALALTSPATTALRKLSLSQTTYHVHGERRHRSSIDQVKTPSSITVRKASSAQKFDNVLCDEEPQSGAQPLLLAPPSVELVAFYSEHRPQVICRRTNSVTIVPAENSSHKNPLPQSSSFYSGRRQSEIADLAITFADVHVAPGTFLVDEASRQESIALHDVPQRVSAVQFRSRNSVHEIIWREDEMTSISSVSSSSNGSSSPDQRTQFQTISSIRPDMENSTAQLSRSSTQQGMSVPFIHADHPLSLNRMQSQRFSVPWGKTGGAVDADVKGEVDGSQKSGSAAPTNDSANVSFSPPHENQRLISKQSSGNLEEDHAHGRRVIDLACGSPRLWEAGKTGSHLGVSSHQSRLLH